MASSKHRPKAKRNISARLRLNKYNTASYLAPPPIPEPEPDSSRMSVSVSLIKAMMDDLDQDSVAEVVLLVWEMTLVNRGNLLPSETHVEERTFHTSLNAYMPDGILTRISDYDDEWYLASRERDFPSPYQALFLDDQYDAAIATAISDKWSDLHEANDLVCDATNHWGLPWSDDLPSIDVNSPPYLEDLLVQEIAAWRHAVHAAIRQGEWIDKHRPGKPNG